MNCLGTWDFMQALAGHFALKDLFYRAATGRPSIPPLPSRELYEKNKSQVNPHAARSGMAAFVKHADAMVMEPYLTYQGSVYKTDARENPRMGSGVKGHGGGVRPSGFYRNCQLANHYLSTFKPRITKWDWKRVLKQCVETDMVYLDVPYYGRDTSAYQPLPDEDYKELIRLLLRAPYKWILSEYNHPVYQPLTDRFGPPLKREVFKHGSLPINGRRPTATECLWANYDIRGILCPEGTVDINHAIEQLEKRREEIDVAIRVLKSELANGISTAIKTGKPSGSPTGRHSKTAKKHGRRWSPEARAAMSARLKASWANRKKGKKASAATA